MSIRTVGLSENRIEIVDRNPSNYSYLKENKQEKDTIGAGMIPKTATVDIGLIAVVYARTADVLPLAPRLAVSFRRRPNIFW
jgi:hypothetical protein